MRSLGSMHFTIRYDTRCYFNVRSKADISQLNLPHGTDNYAVHDFEMKKAVGADLFVKLGTVSQLILSVLLRSA